MENLQTGDHYDQLEGLRIAREFLLPIAGFLVKDASTGESEEDMRAVEHVRSEWFALLTADINSSISDQFHDILSKLTEESALLELSSKMTASPLEVKSTNVERIYSTVQKAKHFKQSNVESCF